MSWRQRVGLRSRKRLTRVLVPTPPEIAGERPQALLRGADEAVEGAGLADDGSDLAGGFDQHANLVLAEDARVLGLHDEDALQNSAVDQRHAEEGVVHLFAGLLEVLEAGMIADVGDGDGQDLLGDQAGEALADGHAQGADAAGMQAERGGENQVGAVGLQQIGRADIRAEAHGDQGDDIHQGVGRLAALPGEVGDLFHRQDMIGISFFVGLAHQESPSRFDFAQTCNRAGPGQDDLCPWGDEWLSVFAY